ncbi:thioredoxin-dependent thiol peroxidase [Pseudoneobacillus sp. C159]
MTVQIGELAPDFQLESNTGETIKLSDYRGKNVVLYFYPQDMTPTCTTQACNFRDYHQNFQELDTVILGVSPDPIQKHEKFINKHGLPFLLLADVNLVAAKAYHVWKLKKTFGKEYMGIIRSTFIIDKNGCLVKEWRNIRIKGHVEEALTYIKEHLS